MVTAKTAVKTQIWIAVSSYVLIAILRKRLGLEASLYEILQVLSLNLFERTRFCRPAVRWPPKKNRLCAGI